MASALQDRPEPAPISRLERLAAQRAAERRARAVELARAACLALERRGVEVRIVGSLATGRFGTHSDIDLLVTRCPRYLKYGIESDVEDVLMGFPFNLIYLDEVSERRRDRMFQEAMDARDLR